VRTASLAYDAVSLIAALVKTQGPGRFSPETLINPSGFAGIDGVFRFKADGTSERGLAVFEIRGNAARVISPSPRNFSGPGSDLRPRDPRRRVQHRSAGNSQPSPISMRFRAQAPQRAVSGITGAAHSALDRRLR
jgi:hypothetical protein